MSATVYRLTKPQAQIFASKKRFKLVNAGRRFGKSWLAGAIIMDACINNNKKTVIYIAPTLNMARNIMWDTWIKDHIPDEYVERKNEQLMVMTFKNGSKFYCLSAEHPDRLRGLAADLLIVDECAIIDNGFLDIVQPLLADRHHDGRALYISTPKGYNWFYDLYCKGMENPDTWDCFQFTTIDGGNVTPEEVEEQKKTMSKKMFAQEYMASFESVSNRIYENFDKTLNGCKYDEEWQYGDIHVGMDFNVSPMTAAIAKFYRGSLYFFDEIVENNSNTQATCDQLKARFPEATIYVYPDPTGNKGQTNAVIGQTDMTILQRNGFIVCAPNHPYPTKDKFNTCNTAFCDASGGRHVFMDSDKCRHLRKAWEGYAYKDNGEPDKSSGLDHISDAAAYLICYKLPYFTMKQVRRPRVLGV